MLYYTIVYLEPIRSRVVCDRGLPGWRANTHHNKLTWRDALNPLGLALYSLELVLSLTTLTSRGRGEDEGGSSLKVGEEV